MKQVFQNLDTGDCVVADVPVPRCRPGHLLVRSRCSLISTGTERSLVEFGRAGYLEKARREPDRVKDVLDKVRADGLLTTLDAVRSKLTQPVAMGYSNVGEVIEVGSGVDDFEVGDRVVSNGSHAEVVLVPKNLCTKIPDEVPDHAASFAVVGAIGLQGIRLAEPTLGETFVVVGLGLIGLLTVQLLRANGCRVVGTDLRLDRLRRAERLGADVVRLDQGQNPVEEAKRLTRGVGVDGVIITASAKSNQVIRQAAEMCRKRGRIVLVGVVGLDLRRSDFYEKELTFQVSCSYGPGRYDPAYEEQGQDYPLPYVRWTEKRNFEAVLELMAAGALTVEDLISSRHPIADAPVAYRRLIEQEDAIGILLEYPDAGASVHSDRVVRLNSPEGQTPNPTAGVVGAIGSGNYASRVLLPAFKAAGGRLKAVASAGGRTSTAVGRTLGFELSTTEVAVILEDPEIDTVAIATRHDTHAALVVRALDAGKHVFVEKPLALTHRELDDISAARERALARGVGGRVMVGFNRRFAPLTRRMQKELRKSSEPISLVYLCNAGAIPAESWVHDPEVGGGRIVGEACHFLDLARFLVGHPVAAASAHVLQDSAGLGDTATLSLRFADGSIGTIHYFANGDRTLPKERVEVFQGGRTLVLDNFRSLKGSDVTMPPWARFQRQDKGQDACTAAFLDAVRTGAGDPIPFEELVEVSRLAIELAGTRGS